MDFYLIPHTRIKPQKTEIQLLKIKWNRYFNKWMNYFKVWEWRKPNYDSNAAIKIMRKILCIEKLTSSRRIAGKDSKVQNNVCTMLPVEWQKKEIISNEIYRVIQFTHFWKRNSCPWSGRKSEWNSNGHNTSLNVPVDIALTF